MFEETHKLTDGRIISFSDFGKKDGVALFQFHGTPGARITGLSEEEVSKVTTSGFRIVSPDRPGYGHSTLYPQSSFESWADDIRQLANHLGIDQFHVLGVSGGGPFALACVAYLQERVISATLVSSTTPTENVEFWQGMGIANKIFFLATTKLPIMLTALCHAYGRLGQWSAARSSSESSSEPFRQGGAGIEADLRLVSHPWNIPLKSIKAPVYLWHGEKDVHSPVAGARVLASQIQTCETYFLPEKDHFLLRDPEINKIIEERIHSSSAANPAFERDRPDAACPSI
ncbi:MAG: alpha/beta hydrolase [Gallionellaceae bacterium]|nr:MAG: alpha/beta hydrolase [Gallionellaceae bacterium]